MMFTRAEGGTWDLAGVYVPEESSAAGTELTSRIAVDMGTGCTGEQEAALRAQAKARAVRNKEAVRFYEPVACFDADEDLRSGDRALRAAAMGLFAYLVRRECPGMCVVDEAILLQGGVLTAQDNALYGRMLRRYMDENRDKTDYPYSNSLRKYGCLKMVQEVTSFFLQETLRVTGAEFVRGPAYQASKDYKSMRVSDENACGLVLHTTTEALGPQEEAPLSPSHIMACSQSQEYAALSYTLWEKAQVRMLAISDKIMKCPLTHACTMPTVLPSVDLRTLYGKQDCVAGSCYHTCHPMLSYFSASMGAKEVMRLDGQRVIAVCGLQGRAYAPLPILRQWPDLNTLEHMNSSLNTVPGQMQHVCLAFALEDGSVLMFDPTHDQVNCTLEGDSVLPFFTRRLHVSHGASAVQTKFYAHCHADLLGMAIAVRNLDVLSSMQTKVVVQNPGCFVKILRARRLSRAAATIQCRWRYTREVLLRKYKVRVQSIASVRGGLDAVEAIKRHEGDVTNSLLSTPLMFRCEVVAAEHVLGQPLVTALFRPGQTREISDGELLRVVEYLETDDGFAMIVSVITYIVHADGVVVLNKGSKTKVAEWAKANIQKLQGTGLNPIILPLFLDILNIWAASTDCLSPHEYEQDKYRSEDNRLAVESARQYARRKVALEHRRSLYSAQKQVATLQAIRAVALHEDMSAKDAEVVYSCQKKVTDCDVTCVVTFEGRKTLVRLDTAYNTIDCVHDLLQANLAGYPLRSEMKYTSVNGVDLSGGCLDSEPRCLRNGDIIVASKVTRAPTMQDVTDCSISIYEDFGPVLTHIQLDDFPGSEEYQAKLDERFTASRTIVGVYNDDYQGSVKAVFKELGWD